MHSPPSFLPRCRCPARSAAAAAVPRCATYLNPQACHLLINRHLVSHSIFLRFHFPLVHALCRAQPGPAGHAARPTCVSLASPRALLRPASSTDVAGLHLVATGSVHLPLALAYIALYPLRCLYCRFLLLAVDAAAVPLAYALTP